MKLKVVRTVLIGFAFLSICAFWQMYNNVIPLMLTKTFHLDEAVSGAIMAADNVLALFLLPLFGAISDRCDNPWGKRMPFIVFGTLAAVFFMVFLPILDNLYAAHAAPWKLYAFIGVLFVVLVVMAVYRTPAVALMSDITPKPLRSKANAIINLMGALGVISYLIIASILYRTERTEGLEHVDYLMLFVIIAAIMVVSVLIVALSTRERKFAAEVEAYEAEHPEENLAETDASGKEVLPREVKFSLAFLLISIALWFIGYNAMETWFTTYASSEWGMSLGSASTCLIVGNIGAIASYIPVGIISGKVGRKPLILAGIIMLGGGFAFFAVWTFLGGHFSPILYAVMAIIGSGWAAINVNSLPMVVEMCRGSDVGRFTGFYYTFSMAAQTISPILAGFLMKNVSYRSLFVYSAVFVAASFLTMQLVKHGDVVVDAPARGLEAFDVE